MLKSLLLMLPIFAVITGCQSACKQSVCDGFEKLRPSLEISVYITTNDRPFANQVAAQNKFGKQAGCWG